MAAKKDEDEGLVTFERRHMPPNELPEWETCQSVISAKLHIDAVGTVVEHGHGMLQAYFSYFGFSFPPRYINLHFDIWVILIRFYQPRVLCV